ncbi:MAG: glycosyltransferase [Gammaproteobacteria bacterium]|nr:glycosyltransferase [Gammaproteobacteria bacterium]MDH5629976.1 glycosyltransferase [Gammaproteobacteria bacterium]
MAEPENKKIDISICIPTHNRSDHLANNLEHLLTFSLINFEIIIGDNASTDNTENVVQRFINKFSSFTYHRHTENIGFSRNMDSILRMARGEYIYIISDDDILFENALLEMKNILDTVPTAVAIAGKYLESMDSKTGFRQNYDNKNVIIFKQGDFAHLAKNILVCDGHPFMRRELFQRHCIYNDRSFCLMPLFFKLLSFGDIHFIQEPVFQHLQNIESLSTKMTEHWFIDYTNADIELALSDIIDILPPNSIEKIRRQMHHLIYLHAARMALSKNDYSLMWHFFRRLKAVGGLPPEDLIKCEATFLLRVVIERICVVANELGVTTILFQDNPLMQKLKELVQSEIKGIVCKSFISIDDDSEHQLYLLQVYDRNFISLSGVNKVIALADLLEALRLTSYQIGVNVGNDQINISYLEETAIDLLKKPSLGFQIINSQYYASAE